MVALLDKGNEIIKITLKNLEYANDNYIYPEKRDLFDRKR